MPDDTVLDPKLYPPSGDSLRRIIRSGWTIGDIAFSTNSGRAVWRIEGSNGENRLEVEGSTPDEAWHRAVEAAAACGMLRAWPRPSRGVG
jgi:hypothetical protein